jgi:hypothetical protein
MPNLKENKVILTKEHLREFLRYNLSTGEWFWIKSPRSGISIGKKAGTKQTLGYMQIRFKGNHYLSHRLAFLYVLGWIPEQVDHINHDVTDCRWINLRAASSTKNNQNRSIGKNNSSGFVGVTFSKTHGKYIASIGIGGKRYHLGVFVDKQDAITAREAANKKHGFHLNHGGSKA